MSNTDQTPNTEHVASPMNPEAAAQTMLEVAQRLAQLPGGGAVLARLVAGIEALTPGVGHARIACEAITNAKAYLDDAPDVFLRLLAACQDGTCNDGFFETVSELAGLIDAARANVDDAATQASQVAS